MCTRKTGCSRLKNYKKHLQLSSASRHGHRHAPGSGFVALLLAFSFFFLFFLSFFFSCFFFLFHGARAEITRSTPQIEGPPLKTDKAEKLVLLP